ncbi:arrestin domain-containing protein 3-like [Epargyreus clarus]|uniref:arrestin domain-containing protein 3-like n=1 Tax=Epargyreus clarus TaxID=520877 RepID=UPI003C2D1755
MGFDEGKIVFDNGTGVYFTGQTISGKLIFDEESELTFRGIYVIFKGYCKVHWRTANTMILNGRQITTHYVNHNSYEEYFNEKFYLVGSENGEEMIKPGHHEYSFEFLIPPDCPSSLEGTAGHIRYELTAVVERGLKTDPEKMALVQIIAPLDLNTEPDVNKSVELTLEKVFHSWFVRSGSVEAVVKLPRAGYCPGQSIPIEVSCTNIGSVPIEAIALKLVKEITFHASGTKTEKETLTELKLEEVPANTTRSFTVELVVPATDSLNVKNCRYIDIDHQVQVTLKPHGFHRATSKSHKILIGTIPLLRPLAAASKNKMAQQTVPDVNHASFI